MLRVHPSVPVCTRVYCWTSERHCIFKCDRVESVSKGKLTFWDYIVKKTFTETVVYSLRNNNQGQEADFR